ncbi:SLC13 family permease [Alphaproteobacteria bacterium]|nr:SLC13 family permease [Alphaproteobacteria bacterium]
MTTIIENAGMTFEMMFLFSLIVSALFCYANEKIPMEITALGVVLILLFFFHFFPIIDQNGSNILPSSKILSGFANPAMLTVLALLVVGQGVVKTGILEIFSRHMLALSMGKLWIATLISLVTVLLISAFLNNIPVVIIFIPIMQGIAQRFHIPASKLLMPLSFVAVVGGMTTLVGSGTNLLVSNALIEAGFHGFTFFEFTLPGLLLAGTGLAYVTIIAPKFLPHRNSLSHRMRERLDQHFMAEISINAGSRLIGQSLGVRMFHELPDINVRMINRLGKTILPPFTGLKLREDDVIALSATREDLTKLMDSGYGLTPAEGYRTNPSSHKKSDQIVVEMMITPSSSLVDNTISRTGFEYRHNCQVLGIQHHAHMIRSRMGQAKLAAGDLLLVKCDTETLRGLREDLDVVLVEFSVEELPNLKSANVSIFIFLSVVLSAAFGLVPIVISSFFGALAMVATNVISLQQATRALDFKVITTIAAALALGVAMEATGAATYLANLILSITGTASPRVVLSTFFLMVALMSNIISTKTCAVLFAPIGLHIGAEIGIDPRIFAITIVFAANCAFATPFAYQTSLLVMGPGSYHFKDFLKVGSPLVILIWLVYSAFIPWYYGL